MNEDDDDSDLPVWTVIANGTPTVCFAARDKLSAEAQAEEDWFAHDLRVYDNENGNPLWDGNTPLRVRAATPGEHQRWQSAHAGPIKDGEPQYAGMEDAAVYLVQRYDPRAS
jgi:hypothetical protein